MRELSSKVEKGVRGKIIQENKVKASLTSLRFMPSHRALCPGGPLHLVYFMEHYFYLEKINGQTMLLRLRYLKVNFLKMYKLTVTARKTADNTQSMIKFQL